MISRFLGNSPKSQGSIPEVIQSSSMDCGPAALTSVLRGFGIPVSYRELREHCRTAVDGTSIDVLEEVARAQGLGAEQVMLPPDFLLDEHARALPALVVTNSASGFTHFMVAWRKRGRRLQVMDPETGRRWVESRSWLQDLYLHTAKVPAAAWREWAGEAEYQAVLSTRLRSLGGAALLSLLEEANASPGWRPLARLEGALRLGERMVEAGALSAGKEVSNLLTLLIREDEEGRGEALPRSFWSVRPAPPEEEEGEEENLLFTGAVLIRFQDGKASAEKNAAEEQSQEARPPRLPLATPASERPFRAFLTLLLEAEPRLVALLLVAITVLAGAVALEGLLLYGLGDLWRLLGTPLQHIFAALAIGAFVALMLALEYGLGSLSWRLGRKLEGLFRVRLLTALPLIPDLYFQTRPASDIAHRLHLLYQIRSLAALSTRLFSSAVQVIFLAVAITWVSPATLPGTLLTVPLILVAPLLLMPRIQEADLRARTHSGNLSRFFLDTLLGIRVIRAHGAEGSVLREHEGMVSEWMRSSYARDRKYTEFMLYQGILGLALAFFILFLHFRGGAAGGATLLVGYWVLSLITMGSEIGGYLQRLPALRNILLRALELAESGRELPEEKSPRVSRERPRALHLVLRDVEVAAGGEPILQGVSFEARPGEHIAILGPSGAGKSTLVSLLLGWHRPAKGEILVDGEALDERALSRLREETAWIDPSVQLWNRTLTHNVTYGLGPSRSHHLGEALRAAQVTPLLSHLPEGMQQPLGENGGLLSGGEGQRTRIARALLRKEPRLVILDEATRGLDRAMRLEILAHMRKQWAGCTLFSVTHDILPSQEFDRVLIVEGGRLVEQGEPAALLQDPHSRYRALWEAESAVDESLWKDKRWRVLRMSEGTLSEMGS